jgi:hypothetical protein
MTRAGTSCRPGRNSSPGTPPPLSVLPIALRARIGVQLVAGRLEAADSLHEELEAVTEATGSEPLRYGAVVLAAWGGRSADIGAMVDASLKGVMRRGEGMGLTVIEWASAVLYNAAGRHSDALDAAEQASRYPEEFGLSIWACPSSSKRPSAAGLPSAVRARCRDSRRQPAPAARHGRWGWRRVHARC